MDHDIPPGLRFSILNRAFKRKLEERAGEMGLTAVQLQILGELRRLEVTGNDEINQRDLENAVSVTHPTMTEIIKRLEKKGPLSVRRVASISATKKSIVHRNTSTFTWNLKQWTGRYSKNSDRDYPTGRLRSL